MLTIYFSGTGNSRYIARRFSQVMQGECLSIEDQADFSVRMRAHTRLAVCYPIHNGGVPRIMREFAAAYRDDFRGKQMILLCTQMLSSCDGACAFTDLFPDNWFTVIYADHFLMPGNLCNILPSWTYGPRLTQWEKERANAKIHRIEQHLRQHRVRQRGSGPVSRLLGTWRRQNQSSDAAASRGNVHVGPECSGCGTCAGQCPAGNLVLNGHGPVMANNNCMHRYRCVNLCPQKAITVAFHRPVIHQYPGIDP